MPLGFNEHTQILRFETLSNFSIDQSISQLLTLKRIPVRGTKKHGWMTSSVLEHYWSMRLLPFNILFVFDVLSQYVIGGNRFPIDLFFEVKLACGVQMTSGLL